MMGGMDIKHFSVALAVAAATLTPALPQGVPAAPNPTCRVVGVLSDIQERAQGSTRYSSAQLRVLVSDLSPDCWGYYGFLSTREVITGYFGGGSFHDGDIVWTSIHFGGDERFGGYFLNATQRISIIWVVLVFAALLGVLYLVVNALIRRARRRNSRA